MNILPKRIYSLLSSPVALQLPRCAVGILSVLLPLVSLLCACSSDEPDARVPMEYSMVTDAPSRDISTVPLDPNVYSLYGWSIHEYDGLFIRYFGNLGGAPLKLTYANGKFVADHYYYPLSGIIRIASIGINSLNPSSSDIENAKVTNYYQRFSNITFDLSDSDGTKEYIYSDVLKVNCPVKSSEIPPLHFHRPYAALRFNFIPEDANSCTHVTIDSITVPNVKWQGKFTVKYYYDAVSDSFWEPSQDPSTKVFTFSSSKQMGWDSDSDSAIPLVQDLFLVEKVTKRPQIIICYTMHNGTAIPGGLKENDDNVRHLRYIIPADDANGWYLDYQYNYNITVHGNCQMDLTNIDVKLVNREPTGTMHI